MKNSISIYIAEHGKHIQNVKAYFESITLSEAIGQAAKAIDPTNNNKMFHHQRRIGKVKAVEGYELLKYKDVDFKACTSFDEIMIITGVMNNVPKLGNLWSYDSALRIGFHLRIYPKDFYIQAGVVKGYVKLFNKKPRARKIVKSEFPMLAELEAYEIENFLCVWGEEKKSIC